MKYTAVSLLGKKKKMLGLMLIMTFTACEGSKESVKEPESQKATPVSPVVKKGAPQNATEMHEALAKENPQYNKKGKFHFEQGKLVAADLTQAGVQNLSALKGASLKQLILSGNPLEDLSPLKGQPLQLLDLLQTKVKSIESLAGMPLKQLYLDNTEVTNLDPLKGMMLVKLYLNSTPVQSLEALKGNLLKD